MPHCGGEGVGGADPPPMGPGLSSLGRGQHRRPNGHHERNPAYCREHCLEQGWEGWEPRAAVEASEAMLPGPEASPTRQGLLADQLGSTSSPQTELPASHKNGGSPVPSALQRRERDSRVPGVTPPQLQTTQQQPVICPGQVFTTNRSQLCRAAGLQLYKERRGSRAGGRTWAGCPAWLKRPPLDSPCGGSQSKEVLPRMWSAWGAQAGRGPTPAPASWLWHLIGPPMTFPAVAEQGPFRSTTGRG